MFTLAFNGEFQLNYPNEFLEDLNKLKEKHNAVFIGQPVIRNLGNYVDFQKIVESETIDTSTDEEV